MSRDYTGKMNEFADGGNALANAAEFVAFSASVLYNKSDTGEKRGSENIGEECCRQRQNAA